MSIIIRLQNLPWTANAEDIRQFFRELVIPDGGVHIVGGEHGDAFIVFGSDEDARQAMMKDGGQIKDVKVKLLLSSRVEMQKVIDTARQQALKTQNLMQTLASAAPANMQVPLLPNMLNALPALRNLAGMGVLPALTSISSMQTLPTMPAVPNAAALSSLPFTLPTTVSPVSIPEQKTKDANISMPANTQTTLNDIRHREEKDANRRNRSRSRSRSKSRDRAGNRDRHRYDDRSRDHKHHRDRSRSAERDNDLNRNRRRSRSRDRKSRDHSRDRDYHRSKDKKRDYDAKDASPFRGDKNGVKASNQDSKSSLALEMTNVSHGDAAKLSTNIKPEWMPNALVDGKRSGPENSANWFAGMMPSAMINPWLIPPTNDKVAPGSGELRQPISASVQANSELPRAPFGVYPFGHAFPPATGGIYPWALPAVPRPEVPREMIRNFPAPTMPTPAFQQPQPAEMSRKDSDDSTRFGERRKFGPDDFEDDVDCFGRQRRRVRKRSPSLERNNGEFNDKRDNYRYKGESFGHSREFYDEEDRRNFRNNQDDVNRRSGYRRDFDRRDRPDYRRPNFRDRFDEASNDETFVTGTCVEVRNIPKDAKEIDIKKFFSPLPLYDSWIKFQFDHRGSRTRIAFVKFSNTGNKVQALKYSGKNMNDYRVHVEHLEDTEWETAENEVHVEVREPFLKVSFIPKRARVEDITEAFSDPPENVVIKKTDDHESYIAYLKFKERFSVQKALRDKHRILICDSRVKLEPSCEEDFQIAKSENEEKVNGIRSRENSIESNKPPMSQPPSSNLDHEDHGKERGDEAAPSRCVMLTNLPPDISDNDILNFFVDVKAFPTRIHIMFDREGHQTGEVYCEFSNEMNVQNALQKNKCLFDDRSISVASVSEEQLIRAIKPAPSARFGPQSEPPPYSGYRPRVPFQGRAPPSRGYGRPPLSRDTPGVEDFGRPGCVLSLENVPYKADVEDILDFFEGYGICRDDVIRRFNDLGLATGDARVCLRTPEDALRAYRELNRRRIRDRPIFLHLVP